MAEWRKHFKDMWGDGSFCGLSRDARLLWCGLIDHADDDGYLRADVRSIRVQIFRGDTDLTDGIIANLLAEIEAAGMFQRRTVAGPPPLVVGWLPKWGRYQCIRPDRRKESNLKAQFDLVAVVDIPPPSVNQMSTVGIPLVAQTRLEETRLEETRLEETRQTKDDAAPKPRLLETEMQKTDEDPELPHNYNYLGLCIGKAKAAWIRRFAAAPHPPMDLFLRRCRSRDISPIVVMDYVMEHSPDNPIKYIQSLMRQGDGIWPQNGEQNYVQWEESVIDKRAKQVPGSTPRSRRGSLPRGQGNPRQASGPTRIGDLV